MTEEQLKRLQTAMCDDNEHQCNRLNNYIYTDEYLTAEVVKVVEEIVAVETKELKEKLNNEYKENGALKAIIENHEYYQNGYKAGQHDEWVKSEQKIFEAEGKSELRDIRIFDLEKKVEEKDRLIEELKECSTCDQFYNCLNENTRCDELSGWILHKEARAPHSISWYDSNFKDKFRKKEEKK